MCKRNVIIVIYINLFTQFTNNKIIIIIINFLSVSQHCVLDGRNEEQH